MVASRSINVKWQHKAQDTSELTKYILQYKEGEGKLASTYGVSRETTRCRSRADMFRTIGRRPWKSIK